MNVMFLRVSIARMTVRRAPCGDGYCHEVEGGPMGEFAKLMETVTAMGPLIEEHAEAINTQRQLTPEVLAALRAAGVFRMPTSVADGGLGLSPLEIVRVLEELSYHDASTGWVAMICCDGGLYCGMADDKGLFAELYPDPDMLTAGWLVPAGQAHEVEGGYRITGRWSFGSGIMHSERIVGGCLVMRDGQMQMGSNGLPEMKAFFLPTDEVTIHDVWHTTGLAGTSSNDYSVQDVFVPTHHAFESFTDDIARGPEYAYHGLVFAKVCAVPLGLLRRAIVEYREVAETKLQMPSFQPIKNEYRVQMAVGSAQADLDAAWGLVERTLGNIWDTITGGELPSAEQRAALCRMCPWVVQTVKAAVDLLCEEVGTASSMRANRLERVRRDATMLTHHVIGQQRTFAVAGQMMFGMVPTLPVF
jgi:alkylation response protein AidB-like acyl-CoA dehydrogenase